MLVMKPSDIDRIACEEGNRAIDPIQRIRARMQFLPERDRLLLELAFKHRLSRRQIGIRLGISPGNVSRTLRRVINRLHDPLIVSLCDPKCALPDQYRQIGLKHFLHRQPMNDLARRGNLRGLEVRRIIEFLRGWQKGLSARR